MQIRTIGTVREGATAKLVVYLQEVDEDFNASGLTLVDMYITGIDGQPVDTAGKFGWEDQDTGAVYYNRTATDFRAAKSPYRIVVLLEDGDEDIRTYAETFTAEIVVLSARA